FSRDWSSDVCSSDLAVEQRDARGDPSVQALVALREEASHALVERLAVVLTYPSRDAQVRQELHLRIPDGEAAQVDLVLRTLHVRALPQCDRDRFIQR